MAVFYNRREKRNPRYPNAPKKFYAVLKAVSQKQEKEIAKLIADETTLNPKEAEMALTQFEKIMIRLLLDGYTVQLGDWGSFRLTCNSDGHDTAEEVTANSIKNLNIRFTPGIELKEAIAKATFMLAENMNP